MEYVLDITTTMVLLWIGEIMEQMPSGRPCFRFGCPPLFPHSASKIKL